MDFFSAMEVSASGMSAERTRINVASSNLANAQTTKTATGGPYQRLDVSLRAAPVSGTNVAGGQAGFGAPGVAAVEISGVKPDTSPPRLVYDPGHPDANPEGYVAYPNINTVEEMVDMITASRAYQAGVTAIDSAVSLAERALGIGR